VRIGQGVELTEDELSLMQSSLSKRKSGNPFLVLRRISFTPRVKAEFRKSKAGGFRKITE
jgi:hypothetical protein